MQVEIEGILLLKKYTYIIISISIFVTLVQKCPNSNYCGWSKATIRRLVTEMVLLELCDPVTAAASVSKACFSMPINLNSDLINQTLTEV